MNDFDKKDLTVSHNVLHALRIVLNDIKNNRTPTYCLKKLSGDMTFDCARFFPASGCDAMFCPCHIYEPEDLIKEFSAIIEFNTKHEPEA